MSNCKHLTSRSEHCMYKITAKVSSSTKMFRTWYNCHIKNCLYFILTCQFYAWRKESVVKLGQSAIVPINNAFKGCDLPYMVKLFNLVFDTFKKSVIFRIIQMNLNITNGNVSYWHNNILNLVCFEDLITNQA